MWIARDKDGSLWLYEDKPEMDEDRWVPQNNSYLGFAEVDEFRPFSKLTWENSPLELIIKTEESEGEMIRTDKEIVEEVYSHLDSIKETVDRMTSGNFMHNKAAIKFSANTIMKVLELMGLNVQKEE